jgi:hypothetical protein
MAARIAWVLLIPALLLGGLSSYLAVALACSDDSGNPDEDAVEFCSRTSDGVMHLLAYSGLAPFVLVLFGAFLWGNPQALRWFNGFAFVLAGIVLTSVAVVAAQGGVAAMIVTAWLLAAMGAAVVIVGGRPG